ncbi:SDR family oxidoreductase [Orrella sp. NBD-18]|uniref:SDR family oxidoreductase n=1 Tax=Sheuella amnicola TaxID=2707330 RepID=A0A6B2QZI4_9BURK|nr:SDR family oxidoreductase [Sheuella amnicola]NDY83148.1 SDR family oxidoreductase [Sheuella amnicola]HBI83646.1 short-chain dehydrogenase [Alcaligenaceae bacterium]
MKGATALVTGGSRGIGRAVVQRLLDEGYEVLNFSRTAPKTLLPGEIFESVDLGNPTRTREAIGDWAAKKDILNLVNNAGMIHVGKIEDITLEQIDDMVNLNMVAPLLLTQGVLPAMRANRYGRIVNIGSRAALGKSGRTIYGGTKAGLVGMTRTWALETASQGITVNLVAPGPIETELFTASNPPESPQTIKIRESIPVQRFGTPEEIAHAVAMFVDKRAGFMTGQVLYVCGGMSVGLTG